MSDTCPVVKIVSSTKLGYALLNESDFDPVKHKLWRDALDHDGDGFPGGSLHVEPTDELTALRARYAETFGKKPWHGWDVAALRQKIDEKGTGE